MKPDAPRRPHTPADIVYACQLRDGGWTYREIQRELAKDGVLIHENTVGFWTNPSRAASHRRSDSAGKARRRAAQAGGGLRTNIKSQERQKVRVVALREAGLGCGAIAAVMRLDFENGMTEKDVRRIVGDTRRGRLGAAA